MYRIEKLVFNTAFFLLCLLTILLIFEQYIEIPFWLQPLGRMHPIMLHFPVALIGILVLANLFKKQLDPDSFKKVNKFLLWLTVLTTILAAIMGLFLSREGYSSDLLQQHKWWAAVGSFVIFSLLIVYKWPVVYRVILFGAFLCIIVAGHMGAGLTHGSDFLLEPITSRLEAEKEVDDNAPIFTQVVQPIIKSKCQSCHNDQKSKGGLNMASLANINAGGESGPLWINGDADNSELIKRVLLPVDHKDHMPPEGKSQLTHAEVEVLREWIQAGADSKISLAQLNPKDDLFVLASQIVGTKNEPGHEFEFADSDLVEKLNNPYRSVSQKSFSSPALDVTLFGQKAYKLEYLNELEKISDQVISLNVSSLPVQDNAIESIAKLKNLEELNLNFTQISGKTLSKLETCTKLKSLSLSGTQLDSGVIENLKKLPSLKKLFLWDTNIQEEKLSELKEQLSQVQIDVGFKPDSEKQLKLGPPVIVGKKQVVTSKDEIQLKHKLRNVELRYTTDGSEPDSTSQLYETPLTFDSTTVLKVRAFKKHWVASNVVEAVYAKKGLNPQRLDILTETFWKFRGNGEKTLMDDIRGSAQTMPTFDWLGFDKSFEATAYFGNDPPTIRKFVLGYGVSFYANLLPPQSVEIWGGNDSLHMMPLASKTFPLVEKDMPTEVSNVSLNFPASSYKYYKIKALSTDKLPDWHYNKHKEIILLIDEIFFY